MRIFRNSTAAYLLLISARYGQLPYRALCFLSLPYETAKDDSRSCAALGISKSSRRRGIRAFFSRTAATRRISRL